MRVYSFMTVRNAARGCVPKTATAACSARSARSPARRSRRVGLSLEEGDATMRFHQCCCTSGNAMAETATVVSFAGCSSLPRQAIEIWFVPERPVIRFGHVKCHHSVRYVSPRDGAVEPAKFVRHHASASGRKLALTACALVHVNALRRAGTQPPAMAPLPFLAQHWLTTNCDTTETCC